MSATYTKTFARPRTRLSLTSCSSHQPVEGGREKQRHIQTDTDRQTDRQTDGQKDKQTETELALSHGVVSWFFHTFL